MSKVIKKSFVFFAVLFFVACNKSKKDGGEKKKKDVADVAEVKKLPPYIAADERHFFKTEDGVLYSTAADAEGNFKKIPPPLTKGEIHKVGNAKWKSIAAGDKFALGLQLDGSLWAWGQNESGQLGDGTTTYRTSPVRIGNAKWKSIAAGTDHSVGLQEDGTLWTWGENSAGLLGDGTTVDQKSPVKISGDKWKSIAAGENLTLGVRVSGSSYAWGYNVSGQVSWREGNRVERPHKVTMLDTTCDPGKLCPRRDVTPKWKSVAAGRYSSFGIAVDGTLWAWGANNYGELGVAPGSRKRKGSHVKINGNWKMIASHSEHTLGIAVDGSLWAWGRNHVGQLGDGTTTNRTSPVKIGSAKWKMVAVGSGYSIGIQADDSLWIWGDPAQKFPAKFK